MEFIIGLIVVAIGVYVMFFRKQAENTTRSQLDTVTTTTVETAPYKVPEPAATTQIPLVVATPPPVIVEPVAEVVVETVAVPEKKKRTYTKKPVVSKPAAITASAKKPRAKKS